MSNIIWKIKTFEEFTVPELYNLLKARSEVFVVEQNCVYLDADGYDQQAIHVWAEEEDGEILAYCRVFDKGIKFEETSLGRVITTQKGRGRSLGKQLIQYAVDTIENRYHTSEIRISAQDYL